mgnify:CR=1 FL=1
MIRRSKRYRDTPSILSHDGAIGRLRLSRSIGEAILVITGV